MSITIEVATRATGELLNALNALVPQLSTSASPLTMADLEALIGNDSVTLFVASSEGSYVGTLTLVMFPIPTGLRAWIEDVIVDEGARGQGVGAALTVAAIDLAGNRGVKTIDLTSRPSREAANALYLKLGFQPRQTNVYRFFIGDEFNLELEN